MNAPWCTGATSRPARSRSAAERSAIASAAGAPAGNRVAQSWTLPAFSVVRSRSSQPASRNRTCGIAEARARPVREMARLPCGAARRRCLDGVLDLVELVLDLVELGEDLRQDIWGDAGVVDALARRLGGGLRCLEELADVGLAEARLRRPALRRRRLRERRTREHRQQQPDPDDGPHAPPPPDSPRLPAKLQERGGGVKPGGRRAVPCRLSGTRDAPARRAPRAPPSPGNGRSRRGSPAGCRRRAPAR